MPTTPTTPMLTWEFTYTHVDNLGQVQPSNTIKPRWSYMLSTSDCRDDMRRQGYYLHQVDLIASCGTCQGAGTISYKNRRRANWMPQRPCPACKGQAEISRRIITECGQDLDR